MTIKIAEYNRNNVTFAQADKATLSGLLKANFSCVDMNIFKNQVLDSADSLSNDKDITEFAFTVKEVQNGRDVYTLWVR